MVENPTQMGELQQENAKIDLQLRQLKNIRNAIQEHKHEQEKAKSTPPSSQVQKAKTPQEMAAELEVLRKQLADKKKSNGADT